MAKKKPLKKVGFRTPRKFIALKVKAIKKWRAQIQPKFKKK